MAVYRNKNTVHITAAQTIKNIWEGGGRLARVHLTNADAGGCEMYLYDTDGAATAARTVFHAQIDVIGSEASLTRPYECGIVFETGVSVVLTGAATKATLIMESAK